MPLNKTHTHYHIHIRRCRDRTKMLHANECVTSVIDRCRPDLRHVGCLVAEQSEVVLVNGALKREEAAQIVALIGGIEAWQPLVPNTTELNHDGVSTAVLCELN